MYRFERLERTPEKDPDPVTHIYRVSVRDDVTRVTDTFDFVCAAANDTSPTDFRTAFGASFDATYPDNDWDVS